MRAQAKVERMERRKLLAESRRRKEQEFRAIAERPVREVSRPAEVVSRVETSARPTLGFFGMDDD